MINSNSNKPKLLIINADDLGWNEHRDKGIFELFETGKIQSATVVMNGYHAIQAINHAKSRNLPLGLHINLTEGILVDKTDQEHNSLVHLSTYIYDESGISNWLYVMHGKFGFRQLLNLNKIKNSDVIREIRAQINLFIKTYGKLPTHIDSHQHINAIPQIAQILARIMVEEYGIYKVRIQDETFVHVSSQDEQTQLFNQTVVDQAKQSREIYQKYDIFSTNCFIGLQFIGSENCNLQNFQKYFEQYIQQNPQIQSIELMSHPGYTCVNFGCEFSKCKDRIGELKFYQSNEFQQLLHTNNIKIGNYKDILLYHPDEEGETTGSSNSPNINTKKKPRILFYSQLVPSTGNQIYALRMLRLLQKAGYFCAMRGIQQFLSSDEQSINQEVKELQYQIQNQGIDLIMGVHIYRTGVILRQIQTPSIGILAGTDANQFIKQEASKSVMEKVCKTLKKIISSNQKMKLIFLETYKFLKVSDFCIIPQSIYTIYESNFSIRKLLQIPNDCKIIVFTATVRKIKDITFTIKSIAKLLHTKYPKVYFLHFGQIVEQDYYQIYMNILNEIYSQYPGINQRMRYQGQIEFESYLSALKECNILLNSSITEGMSTAIIEAMAYQVPVIARLNDGNLELIQDSVNGFVFEDLTQFEKKIQILLDNPEVGKKLADNAQQTYKQFYHWSIEQQKLINLVEDVTKHNDSTSSNNNSSLHVSTGNLNINQSKSNPNITNGNLNININNTSNTNITSSNLNINIGNLSTSHNHLAAINSNNNCSNSNPNSLSKIISGNPNSGCQINVSANNNNISSPSNNNNNKSNGSNNNSHNSNGSSNNFTNNNGSSNANNSINNNSSNANNGPNNDSSNSSPNINNGNSKGNNNSN